MSSLTAIQRRAQRQARLHTLAVFRHADEAYAPFSCPATAECCQLAKTGREPWLWLSEWLVLKERLVRDGRGPLPRTAACPLLDANGRCSVYADRPFGCRTFFCHRIQGPARQPVETVNALLERLQAISKTLDGDTEPKPLTEWLATYRADASTTP
jgi:hypothetical protein